MMKRGNIKKGIFTILEDKKRLGTQNAFSIVVILKASAKKNPQFISGSHASNLT